MIRIESIISDFQAYTKGVIDCTPIQKAYILAVKHFSQALLPGQGRLEMALDRVRTFIELEMDIQSIVAALLLDVHRIEKVSKEELIAQIGKETCELMEQTASIMALSEKAAQPDQVAESLRHLVRATITDIRTLLLTLAARKAQLLGKAGLTKQRLRILSKEALEIYAPIAERLGLNHLRVQLEDLSFLILHPKDSQEIQTYLNSNFGAQDSLLNHFKERVTSKLSKYQPPVVIKSRIKHGYSLFKKSKMTKVDYNHVHDLLGLRILVDSVDTAYKVLGVLNNSFHSVNDRYKNYISFPKPNGYQSLHAFVIDDSGTGFDVQIRTHEMHKMAEMGIASHWSYKASELGTKNKESLNWLEDLSEKLKVTEDPEEALDLFSRELYTDQVYVFTPKGKIIKLPLGASVIDFAYEIHSEIGDHCTGALINGVHRNLHTPLHQGDKIEIITAPNQEPKPEWLMLAKTSKALNHTRVFLRRREQQEAHALGLEMFTEQVKSLGQNHTVIENSEAFKDFLKKSNHKNLENYLTKLGFGQANMQSLHNFLLSGNLGQKKKLGFPNFRKPTGVRIAGMTNLMVRYANCCNPVKGDPIIGLMIQGKGVSIHIADCTNAHSPGINPERLVEVEWIKGEQESLPAWIQLKFEGEIKTQRSILKTIQGSKAILVESNLRMQKGTSYQEILVKVKNHDQLSRLIDKLNNFSAVSAERKLSPSELLAHSS